MNDAQLLLDKLKEVGDENVEVPAGVDRDYYVAKLNTLRAWYCYQNYDFVGGAFHQEFGRYLMESDKYGDPLHRYKTRTYNPNQDKIVNKKIVVVCESGHGDQIFYSRFFHMFKKLGAKKLIVACAESLKPLFARIDGVDSVISKTEVDKQKADYWIPSLSVGFLLSKFYEGYPSDPWIVPDPNNSFELEDNNKVRVGIKFESNPAFGGYRYKRFPSEYLLHISKYTDLDVYSLEVEDYDMPANITPLKSKLKTFNDTCSAIDKLDLVITTDTSVAHLAGAMGKETWVIVPVSPSHYWAPGYPNSTDSPFYKNVKIFRQDEFANWHSAFKKVFGTLETKYGLRRNMVPFLDKNYRKLDIPSFFN